MDLSDLAAADRELVERATATIEERFEPGRHHVGAALRTASGDTYAAVHLETTVGRAAICAEPIAIGQALSDGASGLAAIVAVSHPQPGENRDVRIVSPCGICRELIADYGSEATVIVPGEDGATTRPISELLPEKSV